MQQRQAQGEQGLLSKQVTAELAAIGQQRFQAQRSHGRAATGGLHCEKFPSPGQIWTWPIVEVFCLRGLLGAILRSLRDPRRWFRMSPTLKGRPGGDTTCITIAAAIALLLSWARIAVSFACQKASNVRFGSRP